MDAQGANISEEARSWVIKAHDPPFDDWDRLAEWLERNPDHLGHYENALDDDDWAVELLRGKQQSHSPSVIAHPRRRWFLGAGIAASLLAAVGGWAVFNGLGSHQFETGPGEHRTVELADGSRIILNGATEVKLDAADPRYVELASGEALFDVKHDSSHPFVVMVGTTRLVDAGTVFNVVRDGASLDVAVGHGAVIFQPGANEILLNAGDALHQTSPQAKPMLRKTSPQAVGGWQSGQLQYEDAPLDQIARDLARNIGLEVRAGHGIEGIRFTGTLTVAGAPEEVFARVGPLLGVTFAPEGDAWKMMPANGSRP